MLARVKELMGCGVCPRWEWGLLSFLRIQSLGRRVTLTCEDGIWDTNPLPAKTHKARSLN
jgi:hypothetical protein